MLSADLHGGSAPRALPSRSRSNPIPVQVGELVLGRIIAGVSFVHYISSTYETIDSIVTLLVFPFCTQTHRHTDTKTHTKTRRHTQRHTPTHTHTPDQTGRILLLLMRRIKIHARKDIQTCKHAQAFAYAHTPRHGFVMFYVQR